MLVLSRKKGESVVVADGLVVLTVLEIHADRIRIGVEAPKDIAVNRGEVQARLDAGEPRRP